MANEGLSNLRREASRRAAAATRKMSRLRANGVIVAGSEFDPRRDPAKVARYTTKQLNSYISELNAFTNRRNQFVGASEGAPVPLAMWKQFQQTQDAYNAKVKEHQSAFNNVFVDPKGMTVEAWNRKMTPDNFFSKGKAAHKPLAPSESEIANITGATSLKEIEKNLKKKMKPAYLAERVRQGREQMQMMLDDIGGKELDADVAKLSDYQFNVLWSELDLADNISGLYEIMKSANTRSSAFIYNDKINDVKELIQWGLTLQEPGK